MKWFALITGCLDDLLNRNSTHRWLSHDSNAFHAASGRRNDPGRIDSSEHFLLEGTSVSSKLEPFVVLGNGNINQSLVCPIKVPTDSSSIGMKAGSVIAVIKLGGRND
jgi:hypothetical protein